jgi:hypothetical protein
LLPVTNVIAWLWRMRLAALVAAAAIVPRWQSPVPLHSNCIAVITIALNGRSLAASQQRPSAPKHGRLDTQCHFSGPIGYLCSSNGARDGQGSVGGRCACPLEPRHQQGVKAGLREGRQVLLEPRVDVDVSRRPELERLGEWGAGVIAEGCEGAQLQAYMFSLFMMLLIFISTMNFVLETVDDIRQAGGQVLSVLEAVCIAFFTLEVVLRFACTPSWKAYLADFFTWVDLISVIPFYVEIGLPAATGAGSLGVVRVVRLVRVARIVKVSRYSQSIRIFSAAMMSSLRPLTMLVFLVSIAMIMFSSGMYFAEFTEDGCRAGGWTDVGGFASGWGALSCDVDDPRWTQLDRNGTFVFKPNEHTSIVVPCACTGPNPYTSIPATFWWCIVTMTTVGYGDHFPVTPVGKIVAVFTMISGIIILALPITVIGTNFSRVLREIQQERMLEELNKIDRDGDGLIDEEELALMIQHMAAVAGDLPKELIPDAKLLLEKYDADKSGALSPDEIARLRRDVHEILGAVDDKADAVRDAHPPDDDPLMKQGSKGLFDTSPLRPDPDGNASSMPESTATPAFAIGTRQPSQEIDFKAETRVPFGAPPSAAQPEFFSGPEGLQSLSPAASAVVQRLDDIETRLDDKLVAIIDLLKRMNAAVASAAGSDGLM